MRFIGLRPSPVVFDFCAAVCLHTSGIFLRAPCHSCFYTEAIEAASFGPYKLWDFLVTPWIVLFDAQGLPVLALMGSTHAEA